MNKTAPVWNIPTRYKRLELKGYIKAEIKSSVYLKLKFKTKLQYSRASGGDHFPLPTVLDK